MMHRRGFLGMLGGAAAAAIAAPVLAKVAPTEEWTAWYEHVLNASCGAFRELIPGAPHRPHAAI